MSGSHGEQIKGVMWFVFHSFVFAIISIFFKKLQHHLNVFEIIFLETLFALIIMTPYMLLKCRSGLKEHPYKLHMIRALFWLCASVLFYRSLLTLPVPKAISLSFAVPLFTTIMAVIFLKEKLHIYRILSLITGFIGMLVIIQPGMGSFEMASLLVVAAAFMWSTTDIIIKVVGKKHDVMATTFFFTLFVVILVSPLAYYNWVTPDLELLGWVFGLAILFIIGMFSVTQGYKHADLTIMMPFAFSQLVFSAILAYVVFGEVVSVTTAIGSAVIITSTSYIAYREKKQHGAFLAQELGEELYDEIED